MCGIVGCVLGVNSDKYKPGLVKLLHDSGYRGEDGFGWGVWGRNKKLEIKKVLDITTSGSHVWDFIEGLNDHDRFIFNTRAAPVTEGGVTHDNIHPHRDTNKQFAVVHNGIISNDEEIIKHYEFEMTTNVDTEVIAHLLARGIKESHLGQLMVGGFSIAHLSADGDMGILRNYKTLYQCYVPGELYVVASERETLQACFPDCEVSEFPKESFLTIGWSGKATGGKFVGQYLSHTPPLDNEKALVVISGGMDSSLIAYICDKVYHMKVSLIHFDYGHKSLDMETEACQAIARSMGVELELVDLPWLGNLGNSPLTDDSIDVPLGRKSSKTSLCWVPARNLVMLSLAAAYAEAKGIKYIFYGSNLEEEGPAWKDNDQAAVEAFDNAFYYGTLNGVRVFNIMGRLMKKDIVTLGTHLGVPLDKTCSCDEPHYFTAGERWFACGRCGACHNRRHAYIQAGLEDPQSYAHVMIDEYPSLEKVGIIDIDRIIGKLPVPQDSRNFEKFAVREVF